MTDFYLINPYTLLGVNTNSSIDELKKSYRELALLCHPDKGGNANDMCVIHNAYKYVKEQLMSTNNNKTYEDLENDFKTFCKNQENTPPSYYTIHKEFNDEFNKKFVEMMESREDDNFNNFNNNKNNPFELGYGHLMDESTYNKNEEAINYNINGIKNINISKSLKKKL